MMKRRKPRGRCWVKKDILLTSAPATGSGCRIRSSIVVKHRQRHCAAEPQPKRFYRSCHEFRSPRRMKIRLLTAKGLRNIFTVGHKGNEGNEAANRGIRQIRRT